MSSTTTPGVDPAANAWVMASSALVLIMIPGLGYFYSGLSHAKNALVLLHVCILSLAVVSLQSFIWGFSLSFSPTGGPMIGNFEYAAFTNVENTPYPGTAVSTDVFSFFQTMFAALTAALPFGSAADRTRVLPSLLFVFIWTTLVYDFIAYWTWAPNGWAKKMGYLDFAGGCPVEVASGFSGLALALYLGPRRNRQRLSKPLNSSGSSSTILNVISHLQTPANKPDTTNDHELGPVPEVEAAADQFSMEEDKPHNTGYVVLGTSLLWFGWLGFNGGSALLADKRAGMTIIATNLAGSVGGLVWMGLDWFSTRKYSSVGFCTGAIAGLVAITPSGGFVAPWAAMVIGIVAGTVCRFVCYRVKTHHSYLIDDSLDVFAVHGVGGVIGNILTGVFAQGWVIVDVPGSVGGWLDGNFKQVGYQLAATLASASWAFTITYIICFTMDRIPGLRLRVKDKTEKMGLDITQMGEMAYHFVPAAANMSPFAGFTDDTAAPRVPYNGNSSVSFSTESGTQVESSTRANGKTTTVGFGDDMKGSGRSGSTAGFFDSPQASGRLGVSNEWGGARTIDPASEV
ncbi:ammonium transporter family-domain-containing protein [Cladochytrium replicatum]|nr:ammonium transporter family-domain-containing protein [Cladochytrium replicatum]